MVYLRKMLLLLALPTLLFANAVGQGTNLIDVGLTGWGDGIGIVGEYERGVINDMFTAGGGVNIWLSNGFFVNPKGRFLWHPFGLDAWNPAVAEKMDIYVGAELYLHIKDGFDLDLSTPIGIRYFVKPSLGLWAEVGWHSAHLGVTFKL